MIKCLAFSLLLALASASGWSNAGHDNLIKVGLDDDARALPAPVVTPSPATPHLNQPPASTDPAACEGVTFTRNLKYGEDGLNVLDVATGQSSGMRRPVVVFVAGDSFTGDRSTTVANPLLERAMCFAGRNGLVAFSVSYRLAPAASWPAGSRDVAAAISWIHENADLFGGDKQEIIPIGYAIGAYH